MGKIKKNPLSEASGRIHKQRSLPEDNLKFSFKYLNFDRKFHIKDVTDGYLKVLLDHLKSLSSITVQVFRTNKHKALRAHTIDWQDTSEIQGFACLNEQLRQCEPWQFELCVNEHGRVHGILLDEIFYVVWLDPDHQLYPSKK